MRVLFCVAVLVAFAWLRPDLSLARSDILDGIIIGRTTPMDIIAAAGQLGLMALAVFWTVMPLARWAVRWVGEDSRDPAAERLQQRMADALKPRRTP